MLSDRLLNINIACRLALSATGKMVRNSITNSMDHQMRKKYFQTKTRNDHETHLLEQKCEVLNRQTISMLEYHLTDFKKMKDFRKGCNETTGWSVMSVSPSNHDLSSTLVDFRSKTTPWNYFTGSSIETWERIPGKYDKTAKESRPRTFRDRPYTTNGASGSRQRLDLLTSELDTSGRPRTAAQSSDNKTSTFRRQTARKLSVSQEDVVIKRPSTTGILSSKLKQPLVASLSVNNHDNSVTSGRPTLSADHVSRRRRKAPVGRLPSQYDVRQVNSNDKCPPTDEDTRTLTEDGVENVDVNHEHRYNSNKKLNSHITNRDLLDDTGTDARKEQMTDDKDRIDQNEKTSSFLDPSNGEGIVTVGGDCGNVTTAGEGRIPCKQVGDDLNDVVNINTGCEESQHDNTLVTTVSTQQTIQDNLESHPATNSHRKSVTHLGNTISSKESRNTVKETVAEGEPQEFTMTRSYYYPPSPRQFHQMPRFYVRPQDRYKQEEAFLMQRYLMLQREMANSGNYSPSTATTNKLKLNLVFSQQARRRALKQLIEENTAHMKSATRRETDRGIQEKVDRFLASIAKFVKESQ